MVKHTFSSLHGFFNEKCYMIQFFISRNTKETTIICSTQTLILSGSTIHSYALETDNEPFYFFSIPIDT